MFSLDRSCRAFVALLALLPLAGCSDDDDRLGRLFQLRTTAGTVSGARAPAVGSNWFVYFSSEALSGAGGEDQNGDGDTLDEIAVAVRVDQGFEESLGVAAEGAAVLGGHVYLCVDEALDGKDWNGSNGATDLVLLHWERSAGATTLVDTLDPAATGPRLLVVDDRLYYAAAPGALAGDETSLSYLATGAATTPVRVENRAGDGVLRPTLVGESQELLLVSADEAVEGADLNADGDATDAFVLFLLAADFTDSRLVPTGLAVVDAAVPFHAYRASSNDWTLGVLVDEAAQGGTNLNDPSLFAFPLVPASCAASPDADALDQVLFALDYRALADGVGTPLNTGLAGRDRVVAVEEHVGTLSDESAAGCDLNEDGDQADTVVRWVEVVDSIGLVAPPSDPAQLVAVDTSVPGGALGFAGLEQRFVAVVDEAADSRDRDGKAQDHSLFAWLEPRDGAGAAWTFAHQGGDRNRGTAVFEDVDGDGLGDPGSGASEPYAGTNYLAPEEVLGRLAATFLEAVPGTNPKVPSLNVNTNCALDLKDADLVDTLPVWLDFEDRTLDFDGLGFALDSTNPGVAVAGFAAYFRVSEAEDSFDHNRDGDLGDVVLVRNPLTTCSIRTLGTASNVPGPVIFTDQLGTGVLFTDETLTGDDWNEDGDALDLVVRYFEY